MPSFFLRTAVLRTTINSLALLFLFITGTASAQPASLCVRDDSDRKVCLEHPARRIISLSPGSTELLFAAGAGPRVIAVETNSDYPPEVKSLPRVGGHKNLSVEVILSMKPDLVVVWSSGNNSRNIHKLESLGLTTLHLDPKDFPDISSAIRRLGVMAGSVPQANTSADQFDQQLARLKTRYENRAPVSVFYEIWRTPLMTMNRHQIISKAITLCGGENIFADAAPLIPRISKEVLVARNPEVILGSDYRPDPQQTALEAMKDYWKPWNTLTAVQKQQMFTLPRDEISRPTPRLLIATGQMCEILDGVRQRRNKQEQ